MQGIIIENIANLYKVVVKNPPIPQPNPEPVGNFPNQTRNQWENL